MTSAIFAWRSFPAASTGWYFSCNDFLRGRAIDSCMLGSERESLEVDVDRSSCSCDLGTSLSVEDFEVGYGRWLSWDAAIDGAEKVAIASRVQE